MIDDFGEKLEGAAKDRWKSFVEKMRITTVGDIVDAPLSVSFPEPNYTALLKDGGDPLVLAFLRAARDTIPAKPKTRGLRRWAEQVQQLRRTCMQLLDGSVPPERLKAHITANADPGSEIAIRTALYEALGHEASFKTFDVQFGSFRRLNGVDFSPPRQFFHLRSKKLGLSIAHPTLQGAVSELKDKIAEGIAPAEIKVAFKMYRKGGNPTVHIGRKFGKDYVSLASFPSVKEAREYFDKNYDALVQTSEGLKASPAMRGLDNRNRTGIDRRNGIDVTPGMFMEAFGFRGVQFGNYVENARRQADLNDAYDGLMDLADVLQCPPVSLSLDGRLGLAFGARGRGGRDAASAHFEPSHFVINLTKKQGAGSLAHEWYHAIDNHIRGCGKKVDGYASETLAAHVAHLTLEDREAIATLRDVYVRLRDETDILARSRNCDKYRAAPYYGLPLEITARAFETWVIDRLSVRSGASNDYLANIVDEDVFRAESAFLGIPETEDRYPYPKREELTKLNEIIGAAFAEHSAITRVLGSDIDGDHLAWEAAPSSDNEQPCSLNEVEF